MEEEKGEIIKLLQKINVVNEQGKQLNVPLYCFSPYQAGQIVSIINYLKNHPLQLIVGPGSFFADEALKRMAQSPEANILAVDPSSLPLPQITDLPDAFINQIARNQRVGIYLRAKLENLPKVPIFELAELVSPDSPIEKFLLEETIARLKPNSNLLVIVPEEMLEIPYGGQWLPYDEVLRRMGLTEVKREVLDDNNPFAPRSFLFGKWQLPPEELDGWPLQNGVIITAKKS